MVAIENEWVDEVVAVLRQADAGKWEATARDILKKVGPQIYETGRRDGLQEAATKDGRWQAGMADAADMCDLKAGEYLDDALEFPGEREIAQKCGAKFEALEEITAEIRREIRRQPV